jgi:hypothetical protein
MSYTFSGKTRLKKNKDVQREHQIKMQADRSESGMKSGQVQSWKEKKGGMQTCSGQQIL